MNALEGTLMQIQKFNGIICPRIKLVMVSYYNSLLDETMMERENTLILADLELFLLENRR